MNQKKTFSYVILSIIFVSLGFAGGYLLGKTMAVPKEEETQTNQSVQIYKPQTITETVMPSKEVFSPVYYLLLNENDVLKLYEIIGENKELIKSVNINSQFLPIDDREKLKIGIKTQSKEEGFNLIEDFSS